MRTFARLPEMSGAAAEVVNRQIAVIFAQTAARGAHVVLEAREDVRADERGGVTAVVLGVQCCAVCAHQTRDSRAGHVAADFLLESSAGWRH